MAANSSDALVYVAQVLGGSGWAKVMALALALSVIGTVGTGIVVGARIIYGMASYRTLPEFLSNVSRRFRTPAAASVLFGLLVVALAWVYLLATSVQNAFTYVVNLTGLLFAIFYVLTAHRQHGVLPAPRDLERLGRHRPRRPAPRRRPASSSG